MTEIERERAEELNNYIERLNNMRPISVLIEGFYDPLISTVALIEVDRRGGGALPKVSLHVGRELAADERDRLQADILEHFQDCGVADGMGQRGKHHRCCPFCANGDRPDIAAGKEERAVPAKHQGAVSDLTPVEPLAVKIKPDLVKRLAHYLLEIIGRIRGHGR